MYKIGDVAKLANLPVSTIRYYDNEGLFQSVVRKGDVRYFKNSVLDELNVIECLKKSNLGIKEIKEFMSLVREGKETYKSRYELFLKRKEEVEKEIKDLEKTLSFIKYKCWYYEEVMTNDNEEEILNLLPNKLPKEIQKLYNKGVGK